MTCSSPRGCYGNTVPWLKADMIVNRRDSSERCWLPGTEAGGVAPASHCFRAGRPARHSSRRRLARTPGRAWSWLAARNGGGCTSSGRPEIQQSFSVPSQRATALRSAQPRPGRWPFRTAGRRGVPLISIRESCSARSWCATCALPVIRRIQAPPRAAENYGRLRPRIHRTPP